MKKFLSAMLAIALLLSFSGVGVYAQKFADDAKLIEKAKKIHSEVITLDTHDDINVANLTENVNYTQNLPKQVNLPKMREGGLDVAWFIMRVSA
jgi:hypothetical protein